MIKTSIKLPKTTEDCENSRSTPVPFVREQVTLTLIISISQVRVEKPIIVIIFKCLYYCLLKEILALMKTKVSLLRTVFQIAELEETASELRAQIDTMISREQSLRSKLASKTEEEQKRRQEVNELEEQVLDLRKRLRNEESEHSNARKQVWDNDTAIKNLQDELAAAKTDLEKERKTAKDLEEKMERGVQKLEGLKKIVTEQNAVQKAREQELKTEVDNLKRQNGILRNNLKAMEKELKRKSADETVSRTEISQLKAALEARNEFEKSFVDQMVELEEKLEASENEKTQLANMMQSLNATLHEREQLAAGLSETLHAKDAEILNLNHTLESMNKLVSDSETQCEPMVVKPAEKVLSKRSQTDEQDAYPDDTELARLKRRLKDAQNEIEVLRTQLRTVGDHEREQKGEIESLTTVSEALTQQREINFKLREKVEKNFEDMKHMEIAIDSLKSENKNLEDSVKHWELSAFDNSKEFISIPMQEFDKFHDVVRRMHELERTLNLIEKSEKQHREKMEDESLQVLNYSNFYSRHQSTQTNAPEHIVFTPTQTIKRAISTYMEGENEDDVMELSNPRSRVRVRLLMDMLNMVPKLNRVRLERGVISVDDVFLDDCGFASFMCPRNFQSSMHAQLQLIISGSEQSLNDRLASVQMETELTMQDILKVIDQDPVLDDLSRGQKQNYEALEKVMRARTQLIFEAWKDKETTEAKLEDVLNTFEDRIQDQVQLQKEFQVLNENLKRVISDPDNELFEALGSIADEINAKTNDIYELQSKIENNSDKLKDSAEDYFLKLRNSNLEVDAVRKQSQQEAAKWLKKYQAKVYDVQALETELNFLKEAVLSLPGGRDLVQRFEVDQQFDRHVDAGSLSPQMLHLVSSKYPQIAQKLNQTSGLLSEFPVSTLPVLDPPENCKIVRIVGVGSILVAWNAPTSRDHIQGYLIFVDNVKQSIECGSNDQQAIVPLRELERPSLISVQAFSATLKSQLVTVLFPGRSEFSARNESQSRNPGKDAPDFDKSLVKHQVATYDYNPEEQSPNDNPDMELAFCEGDVITTYGDVRADGFFYGEMNGLAGLVPSNFVAVPTELNANIDISNSD